MKGMQDRRRPINETVETREGVHPDTKIKSEWGEFFDYTSGFCIPFKGGTYASVLVDSRFTEGNYNQRCEFMCRPRLFAHIVQCSGKVWEIKTEPTGENIFGLIIYTQRGKALAAGTGKIQHDGQMDFSIKTLYPGITNSIKLEYEAKGTLKSDNTYEATVSVKASHDVC